MCDGFSEAIRSVKVDQHHNKSRQLSTRDISLPAAFVSGLALIFGENLSIFARQLLAIVIAAGLIIDGAGIP